MSFMSICVLVCMRMYCHAYPKNQGLTACAYHLEYEESGLDTHNIKNIISEKRIIYDHSIDKKGKKWNSTIKLIREEEQYLPDYIIENKIKFLDWID